MALPTSYLSSVKNVDAILQSIQKAQAPQRFTTRFLQTLGYSSVADRLFVNVLKAIGFLNEQGVPTQRYYEYLDETQSSRVLAEGAREAYADLFQINASAQDMSQAEIKNKMKTLSQGQYSDSVLTKMATTFKALAKNADFDAPSRSLVQRPPDSESVDELISTKQNSQGDESKVQLGNLVYSIQIHLPESRDPAVYDALFRSLKEHLLR